MDLALICRLVGCIFVAVCHKNGVIADKEPEPAAPQENKDKPVPQTSETKIIEIKVNSDSKNTEKGPTPVKVEEVTTKPPETADAAKQSNETIATITLKVPTQGEQKIEIKNVEASAPKAEPGKGAAPPKDEKEEDDKDTSFFHKVLKFIRSDFRFLVKFGAVLSSALTQLIPLNIILNIRKHRSTKNLKCLNFVSSAVSSLLWSLYGTLATNLIIIVCNLPGRRRHTPGGLLNLLGMWVFYKYCSDQSQKFILSVSSKICLALCLLLFVLYFFLSAPTFLTVVGLFGGEWRQAAGSLTAISYVSPLVSFNEILESRNTSTMPTEISLGNFISSFFMFCYGFIIWDLLVIGPTFLGVISGLIQLTLLFLFPHSDRIVISEVEILDQPNNFASILTVDQEV